MTHYTPESVEKLVEAVRVVDALCRDLVAREEPTPVGVWPGKLVRNCNFIAGTLTAALASLTEDKGCCETIKRNDRSGKYLTTSCGHELWDDEISSTFTHCPYCGKPIKEVTK